MNIEQNISATSAKDLLHENDVDNYMYNYKIANPIK